MMSLGCIRYERWIEERAAGLGEAQRLLLEDHLSGCSSCRREATALEGVRRLLDDAPASLTPRARARAIERALDVPLSPRQRSLPPARTKLAYGAAVAAVAMIAVALFFSRRPADPRARREVERPTASVVSDRAITTQNGQHVTLGHAQVDLRANTAITWDESRATVTLDHGGVDVRVDPAPHLPFRVVTSRFSVEVTGTRFTVDVRGVRVHEGTVRVRDPEGVVLRESLGAGESFAIDAPSPAPVLVAPEPAPPASDAPATGPSITARLTRARRSLAAGHVAEAREIATAILAEHAPARDAAEAETVLAECALVAGDHADAEARYMGIADRYARLAAGENALFSAARLAGRRGDATTERARLERYRERYPEGRFLSDVSRRLGGHP